MFRRRRVVQNEVVAKTMREFFSVWRFQDFSRPDDEELSDTLLLSHDWTGKFHEIDRKIWSDEDEPLSVDEQYGGVARSLSMAARLEDGGEIYPAEAFERESRIKSSDSVKVCGMHCPDLVELGRWIRDSKPLLKAGLVWYLPSYSIETHGARWKGT